MNRTHAIAMIVVLISLPHRVWSDEPAEMRIRRNLVYAEIDGQKLQLDLYVPVADSPPPLVVWIHGGGWRAGSRAKPALLPVTEHGFALASISYRFTDKSIFPAQIHDCKAAIRWLRAYAQELGYNADHIAVAGSSAGGHLALLMGVSSGVKELEGTVGDHLDQSSRTQALIDYFGPSDFVLRGKTQPERAYTQKSGSFALLGGTQADAGKLDEKMEKLASPAEYVSKDDPPLLIFHGDKDEVVLLDQSQRIAQLYADKGLPVNLVVIENAAHGGKKFFTDERFAKALKFLKRYHP